MDAGQRIPLYQACMPGTATLTGHPAVLQDLGKTFTFKFYLFAPAARQLPAVNVTSTWYKIMAGGLCINST